MYSDPGPVRLSSAGSFLFLVLWSYLFPSQPFYSVVWNKYILYSNNVFTVCQAYSQANPRTDSQADPRSGRTGGLFYRVILSGYSIGLYYRAILPGYSIGLFCRILMPAFGFPSIACLPILQGRHRSGPGNLRMLLQAGRTSRSADDHCGPSPRYKSPDGAGQP